MARANVEQIVEDYPSEQTSFYPALRQLLDSFARQAAVDSEFANQPHYILFKLNQYKSLIKIDMNPTQQAPQFWHYNLAERPALPKLKNTIAEFLRDTYKSTEDKDLSANFHDFFQTQLQVKVQNTETGESRALPDDPIAHGLAILDKPKEKGPGIFSIFHQTTNETAPAPTPTVSNDGQKPNKP